MCNLNFGNCLLAMSRTTVTVIRRWRHILPFFAFDGGLPAHLTGRHAIKELLTAIVYQQLPPRRQRCRGRLHRLHFWSNHVAIPLLVSGSCVVGVLCQCSRMNDLFPSVFDDGSFDWFARSRFSTKRSPDNFSCHWHIIWQSIACSQIQSPKVSVNNEHTGSLQTRKGDMRQGGIRINTKISSNLILRRQSCSLRNRKIQSPYQLNWTVSICLNRKSQK